MKKNYALAKLQSYCSYALRAPGDKRKRKKQIRCRMHYVIKNNKKTYGIEI